VGLVQAGVATALVIVAGLTKTLAISIALLDGSISWGSLLIIGFIVFALVHLWISREAAAQGKAQPGGGRAVRDEARPVTPSVV
jgi:hypothetical protein